MIIARLRGGLGNQLFQYAAAKSLALHHNTELKLDLYTYDKHPYRKFELHNFNIDASIATRPEVHHFTGSNKIIRYINKRDNYFRCPRVFSQPHYHFYEDFFHLPAEIYLSGYWQSEKYFNDIRAQLLSWYTPRVPLDEKNMSLASEMKSGNSVSLHVRRGDYLAAAHDQFYGGLTADYYRDAVARIRSQVDKPKFFVFSDEIEWCRTNFDIGPATFVDYNKGSDSYKDLALMTSCKHHIIANSTFSWWGAWLNPESQSSVVIAPAKWFMKTWSDKIEPVYACRYYNLKDIIPERWQKI